MAPSPTAMPRAGALWEVDRVSAAWWEPLFGAQSPTAMRRSAFWETQTSGEWWEAILAQSATAVQAAVLRDIWMSGELWDTIRTQSSIAMQAAAFRENMISAEWRDPTIMAKSSTAVQAAVLQEMRMSAEWWEVLATFLLRVCCCRLVLLRRRLRYPTAIQPATLQAIASSAGLWVG
ncbi:hypothetical protein ES703_112468 [subsurface metagenome]